MNTIEVLDPQEVLKRIQVLRREIAQHDNNLALLKAFSEGKVSLKGKKYTSGAEHYRQTAADKARLPRTLANLQSQRALLLRELKLLLEYDAC